MEDDALANSTLAQFDAVLCDDCAQARLNEDECQCPGGEEIGPCQCPACCRRRA